MGMTDLPAGGATANARRGGLALLATFTAAIFVSAALLFAVQPMFTKMVLPRLGGAPSVWSVAIVFFQAALLAGYAYAHLLTRFAPGRPSVIIHLAVMAAACFACRCRSPPDGAAPPARRRSVLADRPVRGLDRAAVLRALRQRSAAAGLVRAHRSSGGERPVLPLCRQQYRQLPRAALLSVADRAVHPARRPDQAVVARLLRADRADRRLRRAAVALRRPRRRARRPPAHAEAAPPTWRDAATWVALAAVPSGLLVAVTAHISTDVAAVPLLWVMPLALYLLTFVIVFPRRPIIPHWLVVEVQPVFILGARRHDRVQPIETIVGLIAVHLAGVLRLRADVPRRARAAAAAGPIPHRVLSVDVGRRRDRRHPAGADRAEAVQLGRRVSDPDRARGAVPAGPRPAERRAATATSCSARLRSPRWPWCCLPGSRARHRRQAVSARSSRALLVGSVLFWRAPLPFAAIIAFVLLASHVVLRAQRHDRAQLLRRAQDHRRPPTAASALLTHGTTMHGAQRIRDDDGQPVDGPPRAAALLLRRLRHRAGHRRGARAESAARSAMP